MSNWHLTARHRHPFPRLQLGYDSTSCCVVNPCDSARRHSRKPDGTTGVVCASPSAARRSTTPLCSWTVFDRSSQYDYLASLLEQHALVEILIRIRNLRSIVRRKEICARTYSVPIALASASSYSCSRSYRRMAIESVADKEPRRVRGHFNIPRQNRRALLLKAHFGTKLCRQKKQPVAYRTTKDNNKHEKRKVQLEP